MTVRLVRLADKTTGAPYFAATITLRSTGRYRARDFFDIVAVVAGEGLHLSYPANGEPHRQPLTAGNMVLYSPGDDLLVAADEPGGMTLCYVSFPAAEWRTFTEMVGIDPVWTTSEAPPVATFEPGDEAVLRPFRVAIDRYRHDPTPLDLVRFWIDVIPVLFPGSQLRLPGAGAPEWLTEGIAVMSDEANLRGGVPRLLEVTHVTAAHLAVTTRRYFDKTPTELVHELRLRHAAFLLGTTTVSVGEIAVRCGFGSFAYFSTAFRRRHSVTPREYRARAINRFPGPAQ